MFLIPKVELWKSESVKNCSWSVSSYIFVSLCRLRMFFVQLKILHSQSHKARGCNRLFSRVTKEALNNNLPPSGFFLAGVLCLGQIRRQQPSFLHDLEQKLHDELVICARPPLHCICGPFLLYWKVLRNGKTGRKSRCAGQSGRRRGEQNFPGSFSEESKTIKLNSTAKIWTLP